jgi:DNA-binding CsgD family transcriptional regulator
VPDADKNKILILGSGEAGKHLAWTMAKAAILTTTFRLTPSEAKLAWIIARGAPPDIAARELKISRETARNQLKSVSRQTRIAKANWSHC